MKNKLSKYKILFIFFISIVFCGTDGQVRGKITNLDGEPLVGAQVYIETLGIGAMSETDGYYFFPRIPVGIYNISVVMINYNHHEEKDFEVIVNETLLLNISLEKYNSNE